MQVIVMVMLDIIKVVQEIVTVMDRHYLSSASGCDGQIILLMQCK